MVASKSFYKKEKQIRANKYTRITTHNAQRKKLRNKLFSVDDK